MTRKLPLIFSLTLALAGCGSHGPPDPVVYLPTTTMTLGNQKFVMEKATTSGQQMVGLMRRDSLPADHGMIFVFPTTTSDTFWNSNVRFPLDVMFLDENANIVSIQHMQAYNEANTDPVPMRYAIELNQGTAAKLGLKVGDHITLPPDAIHP